MTIIANQKTSSNIKKEGHKVVPSPSSRTVFDDQFLLRRYFFANGTKQHFIPENSIGRIAGRILFFLQSLNSPPQEVALRSEFFYFFLRSLPGLTLFTIIATATTKVVPDRRKLLPAVLEILPHLGEPTQNKSAKHDK